MYWHFRPARLAFITSLTAAAAASAQSPVIRGSVRQVVLDLSVRAKNEKLVRDLKPGDVKVLVDGIEQNILDFRLVSGAEIRKLAATQPSASIEKRSTPLPAPNSAREINLVALVFRAANTEQRAMAQKAALAFINGDLPPHTYIAVLSLSKLSAQVAQSFTADPELLTAAINRTLSNSGSHQPGSQLAALQAPGTASTSSAHQAMYGQSGGFDLQNPATAMLDAGVATTAGATKVAQLEADALYTDFNTEARFEMDQLNSILQQMAGLPGRKTVISMTSTLAIPDEEKEIFDAVVSRFKREGVTLYGVNLNGLARLDTFADARTSLDSATAVSPTQGTTPNVIRAQARQEDQIFYGVRSADTTNALRVLAEETGGFLISDTNDIAQQMPRIMDEVNTHYELAWTPRDARNDGKFHKIEVKLERKNLHVQYRDGYFSLPDLNGHEFQAFELAGLRALESTPLPKDFAFRTRALRFSPANDEWHGVMAFEAPLSEFSTLSTATGLEVRGNAVAIIRDPQGEIANIVSDHVAYNVPAGKRDGFLNGNLTLTLPVDLQPGHWTIEAIMIAPESNTASARRISVYVPKPATPAISSITLSRRVEPRTGAADSFLGPFDFGASRVIPTLTQQISSDSDSTLYFVVYPSPEIQQRPNVLIQYFRDGKQVAQESPALRSDWSGSIPLFASARLAPGEYEVRVTARQGPQATQESAWITVTP